jgi:UDP-N-acetyl-D-galactosamine dehydrogenase
MHIYEDLVSGSAKLSVVGLGYVGMPLAVAFAQRLSVIGYDLNAEKIQLYHDGVDPTGEVGDDAIKNTTIAFTSDETMLQQARFHIVAVPTPVNLDHTPDLSPVVSASTIVGRNLRPGSYVVFESTVYPGVTEDVCLPILERESGLKCGVDFWIGYSPERINPGDKVHTLKNIRKIVSGMDDDTCRAIAGVYNLVIEAGTYPVSSIRTAEAIKVVENSQRDINIAFMNELAIVFDRMGIDTNEVVEGMNTKWNALGFRPGLVGGHCIGVDPYYFIYEAERLGYHSQIILGGRKINDSMGSFIADALIKQLVLAGKCVLDTKIVILGITFKENCPDIRNSKVIDIIHRLEEYGLKATLADPEADPDETEREYGYKLVPYSSVHNADCVVFAVAHDVFRQMAPDTLDQMFLPGDNAKKVIVDVKSILDKQLVTRLGYRYWNL